MKRLLKPTILFMILASAVLFCGVSFATETPSSDCAEDQMIAVYDDSQSNRSIRSDIEKKADIGEVSDITLIDDQKMVLIDLSTDPEKAEQSLEATGKAELVQPNYRYEIQADKGAPDPLLDKADLANYQYYLETTNAEAAWDLLEQAGGHGQTIVGVVDTGVDPRHQDLRNNLVTLDERGHYKSFYLGEEKDVLDDADAHGTHVSGIIGAEYGNGLGGSGVASGHNNDLVKVLTTCASDGWSLYTYDICQAIDYNVSQGARVINMSFGGIAEDPMLERCIKANYDQGVVFVAASGNDSSNSYSTPCDYPTVIAVNASDARGKAMYFSDYGRYKDLSAPGGNIISTVPGDRYEVMSGTSMASPVVAGICGLVLDANPELTPAQVKNILCSTTKEAQEGKGFNDALAYGNVDAQAAVAAALDLSGSAAPASISIREDDASDKTSIKAGRSVALMARVLPAGCGMPVTWSSDNEAVATVDETGKVSGLSEGKANITASCGGLTASVQVRVDPADLIENVQIKDRDMWQKEGLTDSDYDQFQIMVTPSGTDFQQYEFSSSDQSVLFVDSIGTFESKKPGIVTVTLWDGTGAREDVNRLDEMQLTVRQYPYKIELTKQTATIDNGKSFTFEAKIKDDDPEDGIDPYGADCIRYQVSNSNGTIDPVTGKFTAKKAGTCYVIATIDPDTSRYDFGQLYAACKVTIAKASYSKGDYALKAKKKGGKVTLTWKALPYATKYQVQKKSGGAWKTVKTVSSAKFIDKSFKKTSSYRVKASFKKAGKTGSYGWSNVVKVKK